MAIAEPKLGVILHDGPFEVRHYPSFVVAEITVTGNRMPAVRKGLRLLAAYIRGGNRVPLVDGFQNPR